MKQEKFLYMVYLIFVLSFTTILSLKILKGEIKAPIRIKKAEKLLNKNNRGLKTIEIDYLKIFRKMEHLCNRSNYRNSIGFYDGEWEVKKN